jgi:hypothetical protein
MNIQFLTPGKHRSTKLRPAEGNIINTIIIRSSSQNGNQQ